MIVNNLYLKNFRNYENEKIEFSNEKNVFYGLNGQGKTNVIEALYYFCTRNTNGLGRTPEARRRRRAKPLQSSNKGNVGTFRFLLELTLLKTRFENANGAAL